MPVCSFRCICASHLHPAAALATKIKHTQGPFAAQAECSYFMCHCTCSVCFKDTKIAYTEGTPHSMLATLQNATMFFLIFKWKRKNCIPEVVCTSQVHAVKMCPCNAGFSAVASAGLQAASRSTAEAWPAASGRFSTSTALWQLPDAFLGNLLNVCLVRSWLSSMACDHQYIAALLRQPQNNFSQMLIYFWQLSLSLLQPIFIWQLNLSLLQPMFSS